MGSDNSKPDQQNVTYVYYFVNCTFKINSLVIKLNGGKEYEINCDKLKALDKTPDNTSLKIKDRLQKRCVKGDEFDLVAQISDEEWELIPNEVKQLAKKVVGNK